MEDSIFKQGYPIISNSFLPEKDWYNTRLKKFVPTRYLSRTKYRELKPLWIFYDGKIMTHPNNVEKLKESF